MNERQVKIVNMLWEDFKGKLTTSKWAKITKTSQATATKGADLREWWATTPYKEKAARESINVYTLDDDASVTRMMEKILAE